MNFEKYVKKVIPGTFHDLVYLNYIRLNKIISKFSKKIIASRNMSGYTLIKKGYIQKGYIYTSLKPIRKVNISEKIEDSFILELINGKVMYERGYIFSNKDEIPLEFNREFPKNEYLLRLYLKKNIPKLKKISKVIAVVSVPNSVKHNYYHWITDLSLRLLLLKESGHSYDILLTNKLTEPFQKEILSVLGIKHYLELSDDSYFEAKKIICPYAGPCGDFYPDINLINKFKNKFVKKNNLGRRIYISRKDASFRRILNENGLELALERLGFETIILSGLSVIDQATIFSQANIIVAPHGAALTNMIFCKQKTIILEIMTPQYLANCYVRLAQHLNLIHTIYVGSAGSKFDWFKEYGKTDLYVNVNDLIQIIKSKID